MATFVSVPVNSIASKLGELSILAFLGLGLAAGVALVNSKNLPFAWHMRIMRALFAHRKPVAITERAGLLFRPVLNHTSTPVTDCDYNLHKSNSTYFADLDVSRVHLIGALGLIDGPKETARPALGGAACNFMRPIAPHEKISIYTRVLDWDRKWLYVASWMVPRETRPSAQDTSLQLSRPDAKVEKEHEAFGPSVRAVSVARYVFKNGRFTVPPETVLQNAGLLPTAEVDSEQQPSDDSEKVDPMSKWSWEVVEKERKWGKEILGFMSSLDKLRDRLGQGPLLGEY